MADRIELLMNSTIQHGPQSARVYLMALNEKDLPDIIGQLDGLALSHDYSKVFAKISEGVGEHFYKAGYAQEAMIPFLFNGTENGLFVSKFYSKERSLFQDKENIEKLMSDITSKKSADYSTPFLAPEFQYLPCEPKHTIDMANLYQTVFQTYPFPIFDPHYLVSTMKSHIRYFGIFHQDRLVALSSAEMDISHQNAEMTDFATLAEYQGRGLGQFLLFKMEEAMRKEGMLTLYTIARALSPGMNRTFAKAGYRFGGTLVNNTHIDGQIESMNVWSKNIRNRQK